MVQHNNVVPNIHCRKDWQRFIKTRFDQPKKAQRRALIRRRKASTKAPRPLKKFRPVVNCPTIRYNMRLREGRGFSLLELRKAKLHPKYARTVGIAVDGRRRNKSREGLSRNVKRLKSYLQRLVLFPVKPKEDMSKNKEQHIQYMEAVERAKRRLSKYRRFAKTPLPYTPLPPKTPVVQVSRIPKYNVVGTLSNEWNIEHHHFEWRRNNKRLARKRAAEKKKQEKKDTKGQGDGDQE
jgi:large subunit ribosomal protein L13e